MKKPNILLITTDTQRCDTLKCMGSSFAISPNIDKLANEGVMFMQAHTSSPVCSPARCSILTGLHTPIHGCIENGINRRLDVKVFPDYLKEQGYINIMVGKTHFDPIPDSFDIQETFNGEKGKDCDDFYGRYIKSKGYSRSSANPNNIPEELFIDAYTVNTTINCIKKVSEQSSKPFFAFCSLMSPHSPLDPPGKWAHLYDDIELPKLNYMEGEIENHPRHLKKMVGTISNNYAQQPDNAHEHSHLDEALGNIISNQTPDEINKYRKLYYGLASYCDKQIGRLIKYLDDSGLREKTLVIFTSDHGQQYYDHGFNDKHNYYDESWRVPFIMSMPGTIAQNEIRDFAISNDIPTTILAAAGTECITMQGFDLFTPLINGKASPRKCAVGTLYKSAALATKRWKLEYYFDEGEGRLYDRIKDNKEQHDLFNNDDFSEVRNNLLEALFSWRSDICDVNYLIENTKKGGPVAQRVAKITKQMKGIDSERRLNKKIIDFHI